MLLAVGFPEAHYWHSQRREEPLYAKGQLQCNRMWVTFHSGHTEKKQVAPMHYKLQEQSPVCSALRLYNPPPPPPPHLPFTSTPYQPFWRCLNKPPRTHLIKLDQTLANSVITPSLFRHCKPLGIHFERHQLSSTCHKCTSAVTAVLNTLQKQSRQWH